jgi:AraC family transcriptional activator of pobA
MQRQMTLLPLNPMANLFDTGIFICRASTDDAVALDQSTLEVFEMARQSHRDDYHFFIVQEEGNSVLEIDFEQYKINGSALVYIHPGQVHRMASFKNVLASFLAISSENVQPEYVDFLQDIAPVKPLVLKEHLSIFSEVAALCIKLSERKGQKLQHSFLKDGCNAFIGLVISQYLEQSKSVNILSRSEVITKAFKAILEKNFIVAKRPAEYAERLNITVAYMNECVKNTTGCSVSHHIKQRIILEAKRLLYHSDKSVKEIAAELGYDDYPYFSRLFSNVVGMSALTFRNKSHD